MKRKKSKGPYICAVVGGAVLLFLVCIPFKVILCVAAVVLIIVGILALLCC